MGNCTNESKNFSSAMPIERIERTKNETKQEPIKELRKVVNETKDERKDEIIIPEPLRICDKKKSINFERFEHWCAPPESVKVFFISLQT